MTRHPIPSSRITRLALVALLSIGLGCSDDSEDPIIEEFRPSVTEDDVLDNLQLVWRARAIDEYGDLLADDFRYYPDGSTRQELGLEYWGRETELAYVGCLFNSSDVTKIDIELTWPLGSAAPAGFFGPRMSWTRLFLTDDFIDVDYAAPGEELDTYRVEGHTQRFYFRKGRTAPPSGPADTLMYLVEWRDDGSPDQKPFQAVLPTSWSQLKRLAEACDSYPVAPGPDYLPQTSEDNVLTNFQTATRVRNVAEYVKLFSDDFRFYLDPATRTQLGIDYWPLEVESSRIDCWFNSPDVSRTVIDLTWAPGSAQGAGYLAPRETWTKLFLTDVFLDVDFMPAGHPVTTFRIEDQTQRFFFRKGRTYPPSGPADTLTYIVEWRDDGAGASLKPGPASVPSTWSTIKTLFHCSALSAPTRPGQLPQ